MSTVAVVVNLIGPMTNDHVITLSVHVCLLYSAMDLMQHIAAVQL